MSDFFDSNGRLTEQTLLKLQENSTMIKCECPGKLIGILTKIRNFQEYTTDCINKYPDDEKTHRWLAKNAQELDKAVSKLLVDLAKIENIF